MSKGRGWVDERKAAFVANFSEALGESPDKKSCTIFCPRAPSSHSFRFHSFANSRHNPAKGQEKINENLKCSGVHLSWS